MGFGGGVVEFYNIRSENVLLFKVSLALQSGIKDAAAHKPYCTPSIGRSLVPRPRLGTRLHRPCLYINN